MEKIRAENQEIMRKENQIIFKDGITIGQGKVMEEAGLGKIERVHHTKRMWRLILRILMKYYKENGAPDEFSWLDPRLGGDYQPLQK